MRRALAPLLLAACASAPEPAVDAARPSPPASAGPPPAVTKIEKTTLSIDPGDTFLDQYAPDCLWAPKQRCVPGEHCGPPVPYHVACPDPSQGDKATWFALPSHLHHAEKGCTFEESRLCPQPKHGGGACTVAETLHVSCVPERPGFTRVPAFRFRDGLGRCFQHDERVCEDGSCDPIVARAVPCP